MGVGGKQGKEYVGKVYKECAEGIWKRVGMSNRFENLHGISPLRRVTFYHEFYINIINVYILLIWKHVFSFWNGLTCFLQSSINS